jgi:hypothetical protein
MLSGEGGNNPQNRQDEEFTKKALVYFRSKRPECTVLLSVQESDKWTLQRDRARRLLAIWNAYETGGLISSV